MYHILNLYTVVFFKFVVHKMDSKMIKSRMVVLTGREKADVADADVAVTWVLHLAAGVLVGERERER
jgi:hypothetical protein